MMMMFMGGRWVLLNGGRESYARLDLFPEQAGAAGCHHCAVTKRSGDGI